MTKGETNAALSLGEWARLARPSLSAFANQTARHAWGPVAFSLAHAGRLPERLRLVPVDPRAGTIERGRKIVSGQFERCGVELDTVGSQPWAMRPPSPAFHDYLHRFDWLADLLALAAHGGPDADHANTAARTLTDGWIQGFGDFDKASWRVDLVARRILAWMSAPNLLIDNADSVARSKVYHSLAVQARYLTQVAELAGNPAHRSIALTAAVIAHLCFGERGPRFDRLEAKLIPAYQAQVLPDGGHISRSPTALAMLLCDLIMLRDAYNEAKLSIAKELLALIDSGLPMLRFYHLGDGRLAAFNGGGGDAPELIERLLGLQPASARPFSYAPHSHYHRLDAGRTSLIVDVGGPPPLETADNAHAGCFSFEMSSGGAPIIINSGPALGLDAIEDRIARSTPAHSTLCIGQTSTAHLLNGSLAGRLLGGRLVSTGPTPTNERHDEQAGGYGATWLNLSHANYAEAFGVEHHRRLYLQERGLDLRGEERIISANGYNTADQTTPFALRFHIGVGIHVVPSNGETGARLHLENGEVWRFQCRGGDLRVEDSRRYGPNGPIDTHQIVVRGQIGDLSKQEFVLKWALRREQGPLDD